jgi:hypothetical protein
VSSGDDAALLLIATALVLLGAVLWFLGGC